MTQPVQDKIWLTQEAYDKLQAELENLRGPVRQDIIARISAARDEGDLKENGGYHAAKEEQGKIEARIRQLEDIKRKAEVGEMPQDDGIVEPGMKVTSKVDGEATTFLLGNKALDDGSIDVYSPESPLGSAILGRKVGDKVSYTAPTGKTIKVEIVEAKPFFTD
jgi:transcription elongation factor GreA